MKVMVFIANKVLTVAIYFPLYLLGLYATIRSLLFAQSWINTLTHLLSREGLFAISSILYLSIGIAGFLLIYKFFRINNEILFIGKKGVSRDLLRSCIGFFLYGASTGIILVAFMNLGRI